MPFFYLPMFGPFTSLNYGQQQMIVLYVDLLRMLKTSQSAVVYALLHTL